ncbi:MAG: hypothetical protein CMI55_01970 [Parcubacteria group bacterium]|nr:hypothetical protein [Parcubacteria group bacterium]|tara:strand:+ start:9094 stop:10005 length:912 start_codon:yes stop_codon:yes gene_type:complete
MYDLIIIGGGPAAVSAGIYAARKKLKVLLITKDWAGQMSKAALIENYPGIKEMSGFDLMNKFVEDLKKNELEIKQEEAVKEVKEISKSELEVITDKGSYQTKSIIVATGRRPKKLGIKGEDKFIGKGVSVCATCDGPLFRDKQVAIIGGGNAGLTTALELAEYASKVYILEYMSELKADGFLQEKIKQVSKIKIMTNVKTLEIKGEHFVTGLVYQYRNPGNNKELVIQGVFLATGSLANSSFVKNMVELNKGEEIKIDSKNKTSDQRIFAAGDVSNISHKQIIIAAGEGAKAALNVYDYLKNL